MSIEYTDNSKQLTIAVFSSRKGKKEFNKLNRWFNIVSIREVETWYKDTNFLELKKYDLYAVMGSSMGGHGAIACCEFIKPKLCIAMGPQWSVHPTFSYHKEWTKKDTTHRLGLTFNSSTKYKITFSSDDEDDKPHQEAFENATKNLHNVKVSNVESKYHAFARELERRGTLYDFIFEQLEFSPIDEII